MQAGNNQTRRGRTEAGGQLQWVNSCERTRRRLGGVAGREREQVRFRLRRRKEETAGRQAR